MHNLFTTTNIRWNVFNIIVLVNDPTNRTLLALDAIKTFLLALLMGILDKFLLVSNFSKWVKLFYATLIQ